MIERSALVFERTQQRRSMLCELLHEFGYDTTSVDSAAIADAHLGMLLYDVAFVEVNSDDGLAVLTTIRFDPMGRQRKLPIIAVSASSELGLIQRTRDCGVNGFLVTPFTRSGILSQLKRIAEDRRKFIEVDTYWGPDRRRWNDPHYAGHERRAAEQTVYLG